jgi:uncharacterized protein (TIRG00374 family)
VSVREAAANLGLQLNGGRRWGRAAARAGVTVALLALILSWLPTDELLSAIGRIRGWPWLLVLLGFAVGHVVAALKWRLLMCSSGVDPGFLEVFRAHGAGLFANLCLPSLVGGDVVRAGLIVSRHANPEAVAVGGIADRVIDVAALLALAVSGAAVAPGVLDARVRLILATVSLATLLGVPAALVLLNRTPSCLPTGLGRVLERLRTAVRAVVARPGVALAALALSLVVQAGFVLLNAALGREVGITVPLSVWFLCWPLAKIAALVPVSLGGIGVREAALASLFLPFAVDPTLAVAQSLLWETILVALGLIAGAAALWTARRTRSGRHAVAESTR